MTSLLSASLAGGESPGAVHCGTLLWGCGAPPSIVYIDEIEKVVVEDKKRIKAWKAEDRCRPPTQRWFCWCHSVP